MLLLKFQLEEEIAEKKRGKLAKKGIVVRSKEEKRQLKRQKEKERKLKKNNLLLNRSFLLKNLEVSKNQQKWKIIYKCS